MRIGSIDNQIILYMQGNEDIEKLRQILLQNKIDGVPTKRLAEMLQDGVNVFPTISSEGIRDQVMVEEATRRYKNLISEFDLSSKFYMKQKDKKI